MSTLRVRRRVASRRMLVLLVAASALLAVVAPAVAGEATDQWGVDAGLAQSIDEVDLVEVLPDVWGGSNTSNPGWIVALYTDGYYSCSASLIDPRVVLTAAHCVDTGGSYSVLVGNYDLLAPGITRNVVDVHIHPGWGRNFNDTDLALLVLDTPVTSVPTATLNRTGLWPEFAQVLVVAGWGLTYEGGGPSRYLQSAGVYATSGMDGTYDPSYCDLPSSARTVGGIFCFGGPVSAGSCSGDSGGPLVGLPTPSATDGDLVVYGVVSYGPAGCGPSSYDDKAQSVGGHIAWIDTIVASLQGPVAVDDGPYAVNRGGTLTVPAPGVLGNDTAPSGQTLSAYKVANPTHGSVTLGLDGSWAYTHNGDASTSDSFTYQVQSSGGEWSGAATVHLDVTSAAMPQVTKLDTKNDSGSATTAFGVHEIVHLTVQFSDPDTNDTHTAFIDWGDGTLEDVAVAAGARQASATHQYSRLGTATIRVAVGDSTGRTSPQAQRLIVVNSGDAGPPHRVGLIDPSQGRWYFFDDAGFMSTSFYFGNPGDFPILGDWDCDGIETPGMYRQADGYVYLRNSNTPGPGDIRFFFGNPSDIPLAGDFNGDGCDTVSIYRPDEGRFYIINALGENDGGLGAAETSYLFGNLGDKPFVGDFDADGIETVGLHRESTGLVYFRNTHTQGIADAQFVFGDPNDRIISGDWNGDSVFTVALFRPGTTTMYFRYTNSQGNADNQFVPSPVHDTWLPVAGSIG